MEVYRNQNVHEMKDRRPRKLKKELMRRFEKVQASKMVRTALVTMSSAFQCAVINSRPHPMPSMFEGVTENNPLIHYTSTASKAIEVAKLAMNTAEAIANILNESPKNWREA